jgi:hypothetical protein
MSMSLARPSLKVIITHCHCTWDCQYNKTWPKKFEKRAHQLETNTFRLSICNRDIQVDAGALWIRNSIVSDENQVQRRRLKMNPTTPRQGQLTGRLGRGSNGFDGGVVGGHDVISERNGIDGFVGASADVGMYEGNVEGEWEAQRTRGDLIWGKAGGW